MHIVRRGDFDAARAQGAVLGLGAQALADHRILRQRPAPGAPVGQGVPVHRQFRRMAREEGTPLRLVEPDQAVRLRTVLVRGDDQRHGIHVVGERHLERRVVEDRGGEFVTLDQRRVAFGGLAGNEHLEPRLAVQRLDQGHDEVAGRAVFLGEADHGPGRGGKRAVHAVLVAQREGRQQLRHQCTSAASPPGLAQARHVETWLLGGPDDDRLAPCDGGGRLGHPLRDIVRYHHRTVLVRVHEVAVLDPHPRHRDRRAVADGMDERVRGPDPVRQHLEPVGDVGQVAHAAVGDEPDAAETAVYVAVHLAPERAIAAGVPVEVLDHHDAGLRPVVDVGVVGVLHRARFRPGEVRGVHRPNGGGARVADHGAEFGARAD